MIAQSASLVPNVIRKESYSRSETCLNLLASLNSVQPLQNIENAAGFR